MNSQIHCMCVNHFQASSAAFPHDRDLIYHDLEEFPAFDQQIQQNLAKSMLNLNAGSRHVSFDTTGGHSIVFKAPSSRRTSPFYTAHVMDNWLAKRKSSTEGCNGYIELENPSTLDQIPEDSSTAPLTDPARIVEPPGQSLPADEATPIGHVSPVITIASPGLPAAPRLRAENPGVTPELASSGFFWPRLSSQATMASLSTLAEELESNSGSQALLVTGQSPEVQTGHPEAHPNVAMYLEMAQSEAASKTSNKSLEDETNF